MRLSVLLATLLLASCSFGDGPELVPTESVDETTEAFGSDSADGGNEPAQIETNEPVDDAGSNAAGEVEQVESAQEDVSPVENTESDNSIIASEPDSAAELSEESAEESSEESSEESRDDAVPDSDDELETDESDSEGLSNENRIVRIPRTDTANAPKIDGQTLDYLSGTQLLAGEWRFAAQFDSLGEPLGINSFMFGEPGSDQDSNHQWAALHDGVYLYLLVVSDDAGIHFQDTNELRKPWKDDSVELFIDGNNSLLTEYDGVDDFHMTVNLLSTPTMLNSSYVNTPLILKSDTSAILPSDLIFSTGPQKGPMSIDSARGRKDIYEFRIKLSELNIEVEAPFGIEIQLNDDDNGGTRDAKWGWNHPEGSDSANDLTWQNPSIMGTAILLQ